MSSWWLGLSPAQATVSCVSQEHRLRWETGELRALDHHDAEGERTLAALGGQRCTCVDLLDAWERHRDDPRVLTLASRGPTDHLAVNEEMLAGGAPRVVTRPAVARPQALRRASRGRAMAWSSSGGSSYASLGQLAPVPAEEPQDDLVALLGLGGAVPNRLAATVAATWQHRLAHHPGAIGPARSQLQAALYGRVLLALRDWLGEPSPKLELEMLPEGHKPTLIPSEQGIRAEFPFGWLVDVWAKGLATIWGRFCLSAQTEDGQLWKLSVLAPDLHEPHLITLQSPSE